VDATDVTTLGTKYQLMNPENYAALPLAAVQSGLQFGESLLSCKVRDGDARFTAEGECGWAAAFGSSGEQDATASANGYRRDVRTISIGSQWRVGEQWHMGLAAAFERDQIDSATLSNLRTQFAEGTTVHAGMVLKGNFGSNTVAGSLSVARGTYDTHRNALLALHGSQSEQEVYQTGLQFRVSHGFEYGPWYWRPMLDLGFTQVRLSAFSEHGAGANNLLVRNSEEGFVNLRPSLEMGFETALGKSMARWYARLGVNRFIEGGTFGVEAMLEGAPADAGFVGVNQALDRTVRECAAGVDVLTGLNTTLRVGYSGQFSASGTTHGATLKLTRSF
jgi:outer membrane autotransporter protein